LRRLPPPGVLSEKEGDGELGGRVMELMRLGPLSILQGPGGEKQHEHRTTVKHMTPNGPLVAYIRPMVAQRHEPAKNSRLTGGGCQRGRLAAL